MLLLAGYESDREKNCMDIEVRGGVEDAFCGEWTVARAIRTRGENAYLISQISEETGRESRLRHGRFWG